MVCLRLECMRLRRSRVALLARYGLSDELEFGRLPAGLGQRRDILGDVLVLALRLEVLVTRCP